MFNWLNTLFPRKNVNSQPRINIDSQLLQRIQNNDKTLTEMFFFSKQMGDEGAKALAKALQQNQTLTSVDLRDNQIGDEGAKALAKALQQNQTLTSVYLERNPIGDEGAKALAKALQQNQTLTSVGLYSAELGAEGAKVLAEVLKQNKALTSVNLRYNQIGDEGAQALAEALKQNKTLTSVYLSSNQIGPEGTQALAEALKQNKTLTLLDLYGNQIGAEGAQALAEALKQNKALTSLDLQDNQISAEEAQALAEALKQNQTLTSVYLSSNQIGPEGAQALAETLKQNKTLTLVDLISSQIGPKGTQALAEALKQNQILTEVSLGGNQIGNEGAQALAEALKQNQTLTWVELRDNQIGAEGAKALAEALKQNQTLTSVYLERNPIGDDLHNAIHKQIDVNQAKAEELLIVAQAGNLAKVQQLIAKGVALNYQDGNGDTALHLAAAGDHQAIVDLLCSQPHQVILLNHEGEYPKGLIPQSLPCQPVVQPLVSLSEHFIYRAESFGYGKSLGSGTYGAVYQGKWQGAKVAIKKLHNQDLTEQEIKEFKKEAQIMATLSHPHVIKLHGVCMEADNYAMIMEYMPKALHKLLYSLQYPNWPVRYQIAQHVAAGLQHLHSKKILHRDLKSENVLLDNQNQAKLCDFGLAEVKIESKSNAKAKNAQQQAQQQAEVGTIRYMAPECFEGKYSKASDIYSLGILFWELAACRLPYKTFFNADVIMSYVKEGKREELPADKAAYTPTFFKALIKKCTAQAPEQRPKIEEVVEELEANEEDAMQFAA